MYWMGAVMSKIHEQINTYLHELGNKKQKTHYQNISKGLTIYVEILIQTSKKILSKQKKTFPIIKLFSRYVIIKKLRCIPVVFFM